MVPSISNCHYHEFPKDISFSGSGFLSTYQLGVALCFFKYAPWILRSAPCILGSSAGSLIAAAVVCEMNLTTIRDELLLFAKKVMGFRLGPFHPAIDVFEWLKFVLHKYLPADAHCVANGRLGVAMTRLSDGKHFIMSEFQSKEDVIQALLCSCFVPGHSGFRPPTFKGVHYIDGGLSGMQPRLPDGAGRTLTVCPFSGDADICPYDPPCVIEMVFSGVNLKLNIANSFRILNGLYPVALATLEQAFHSGYKDANFFLLSNDLVPSVVTYKLPQSSLCSDQTNVPMQLENTKVEDE
ncbi:patatin-like phospholipase domain-containing protein 2, partial [Melanotaenia boesemani]|uniref:patatin-like phospholipase domain-containing protein 2 n=1 Tax=Melanotaenia boesemani TaxID=1250792 RepID=UPI001C03C751